MDNLQLFNFEGNEVRTLKINDEPYFVGKDVAKILGYALPTKAIRDHVDKEDQRSEIVKKSQFFQNGTGFMNVDLITESGVYSLIFSSKLPNAKRFKHWVTSEVLPAIRKHGAYMTDEKIEEVLTDPDTIIKLATQLKNERQQRQELEHKNEKLQDKINRDADDVVFARAIRYSHHAIPIRELADILTQNGFTIGQNQLYKLLRDEKYLSKQKDFWNLPMSSKVKAGYFRVIHKVTRDGRPYRKTLVTPKGQKHLINKALKGKFDDNYQKIIVSTLEI